MLKVGLTGGIASGKSTVLEMFAARGAHTMRADEVGRELMTPGHEVFDQIVTTFGPEVVAADGQLDRAKLAQLAFAGRIGELNAIVHPAVIRSEDEWLEGLQQADPKGIAILEAALMIEAGSHKRLDKLIVVTCSLEAKVRRFAERTGKSLAEAQNEVERRMAAQIPEDQKAAMADYVIDNSGAKEQAEAQVELIWRDLRRAAGL